MKSVIAGSSLASSPSPIRKSASHSFARSSANHDHKTNYGREGDAPVNSISWYWAASYCNWLSNQEGLPACYEWEGPDTLRIKQNIESLTGYRLPTEGEWEYVARAGAGTSRHYGTSEKLLDSYAWYIVNSENRSRPCGSLQPNDLGTFDMLGNVFEWCQDQAGNYSPGLEGKIDDKVNITISDNMMLRGVSFNYRAAVVRSAYRVKFHPDDRIISSGFRPARTYP